MQKLEDMSRDELLEVAKSLRRFYLEHSTRLNMGRCPFCEGTGYVPVLMPELRESVVCDWRTPVTQEEYERWVDSRFPAKEKP